MRGLYSDKERYLVGSGESQGLPGWWEVSIAVRHGHEKYRRVHRELTYREAQAGLAKAWADKWIYDLNIGRYYHVREGSLRIAYVCVPY